MGLGFKNSTISIFQQSKYRLQRYSCISPGAYILLTATAVSVHFCLINSYQVSSSGENLSSHYVQFNLGTCWAFLSKQYSFPGSRPKLGWNSLLRARIRAARRSRGNRLNPLPYEPKCLSADLSRLLFLVWEICRKWGRINLMDVLPAQHKGLSSLPVFSSREKHSLLWLCSPNWRFK